MKNIKEKNKIIINAYVNAKDKNLSDISARNIAITVFMHLETNTNKKEAIKYVDNLINKTFVTNSNCNFKEENRCIYCLRDKKGCFKNFD